MKIGVFTNEVYDIAGIVIFNKLYGIVIKTKYSSVYRLYQIVKISYYHLPTDKKPQFIKKALIAAK